MVVSCAHVWSSFVVCGGCGCVVGLGVDDGHAVGFTVNTCWPVAPFLWGCVACWLPACVCGGWCGGLFVICIVVVSIFFVLWFCLVVWGIRWMPWHQELMKDVAACDMPRGVGERTVIRGCPNGGT